MPSPFPGMDPYLEGYLWPDVHHRLAVQFSRQLTPLIRPRYVARLDVQVLVDRSPEAELGIMYPDVEVVERPKPPSGRQRPSGSPAAGVQKITEAPLTIPLSAIEVPLTTVEIRDAAHNKLVTSIEILSPINKRGAGREKYLDKCERLRDAQVHLLEIDLLRRGKRTILYPRLPKAAYVISLIRAGENKAHVWPLQLADELPVVPVPLRAPDADVPLDLAAALTAIYDEAAYDLSIDYTQPPPPPALSEEEETGRRQWVAAFQS